MTPNIRRRLLLLLLFSTGLAWCLAATFVYIQARKQVADLFDEGLESSARVLLAFTLEELKENDDDAELKADMESWIHLNYEVLAQPYVNQPTFQIWTKKTKLLVRSADAPVFPLYALRTGYGDNRINGDLWRIFSLVDDEGKITVQAGERYKVRNQVIWAISKRALYPLLVFLPIMGGLLWFAVGRGLEPLQSLANQVKRREPTNLEPVQIERVPKEVKPLATALNKLLVRIRNTVDQERRFTADAAHELRTPLSGIKTQAQLALRAKGPTQKRKALEQVITGVDRAGHLIEELLVLARIDREIINLHREKTDLYQVATNVLTRMAPAALEKNIEVSLTGTEKCTVNGEGELLNVLAGNLIDNAIRYTPAGGRVETNVVERNGAIVFSVANTGPGIPAADREHMFERFHRGANASGIAGSGLGLSIVQRIAELHGAVIRMDQPGKTGLRIQVFFSQPAGDANRGS